MSASEDRVQFSHDRFLMAELAVAGRDGVHQIRVRNLSAGGMMGEGDVSVDRGSQLAVEMPNIGPVNGTVAWVQDDRFGIAFDEEIDPGQVFGPGVIELDGGSLADAGVDSDRRSESRLR